MEGELYMWLGYLSGWSKRYFVLHENVLCCYIDFKESINNCNQGEKQTINLALCEIYVDPNASCQFELRASTTWHLKTELPELRSKWIQFLDVEICAGWYAGSAKACVLDAAVLKSKISRSSVGGEHVVGEHVVQIMKVPAHGGENDVKLVKVVKVPSNCASDRGDSNSSISTSKDNFFDEQDHLLSAATENVNNCLVSNHPLKVTGSNRSSATSIEQCISQTLLWQCASVKEKISRLEEVVAESGLTEQAELVMNDVTCHVMNLLNTFEDTRRDLKLVKRVEQTPPHRIENQCCNSSASVVSRINHEAENADSHRHRNTGRKIAARKQSSQNSSSSTSDSATSSSADVARKSRTRSQRSKAVACRGVTFFSAVRSTFADVRRASWTEADGRVVLPFTIFIDACDCYTSFFDRFSSSVMQPIKNDMDGNIAHLKRNVKSYPQSGDLMRMMIDTEIRQKRQNAADSSTQTLLWLTRTLHVMTVFLLNLLSPGSSTHKDTTASFLQAYQSSLSKHHNWVAQRLFKVALKMIPSYTTFVECMTEPTYLELVASEDRGQVEARVIDECLLYNDHLQFIVQQITLFYKARKIEL